MSVTTHPTPSHQISCQDYCSQLQLTPCFCISSLPSLPCLLSTESPRDLSESWVSSFQWLSTWIKVKSKAFTMVWKTSFPTTVSLLLVSWIRKSLFAHPQTQQIFSCLKVFTLISLCQECFPLHIHMAQPLASFRLLVRYDLKRAIGTNTPVCPWDHSLSFHCFIMPLITYHHLVHYLLICLLAISLPRRMWAWGQGLCVLFTSVSPVPDLLLVLVHQGQMAKQHMHQACLNSVYGENS